MHQQYLREKFVPVFKGQASPLKMGEIGWPKILKVSAKQGFVTSQDSEDLKTKGH